MEGARWWRRKPASITGCAQLLESPDIVAVNCPAGGGASWDEELGCHAAQSWWSRVPDEAALVPTRPLLHAWEPHAEFSEAVTAGFVPAAP